MSTKKAKGLLQSVKKKLVNIAICAVVVATCLWMLWDHYNLTQSAHSTPGHEELITSDDLISTMENKLLDFRFRQRGVVEATGKVGILAVDEKTLQRFGRWPISRIHYEQAFKNLKKLSTLLADYYIEQHSSLVCNKLGYLII